MPPNRVLVVDDDASILRLVATILRRESYDVDTASGGRDALAKIALTPYDVIVLDLMMPDVPGLEVLRSLHARVPHVRRVVVMSAGSALEIARSFDSNVFASLRKPFDYAALVSAVRECIEAARDPAPSGLPLPPVAAAA
jgi:DNA-binding NtrC family response regulator